MPAVVPQLKTITVGGAVAGLGIESSSFRYGLVPETVQEMEVLLSDGRTVVCSKDEHDDLFSGFPNSYGTLGYALRLKVKLVPVKPYVRLTHKRYTNAPTFFKELESACRKQGADFVDGTVFSENEMYLTRGKFVDKAPVTSDYKYMGIYYKSIRKKKEDYLTTSAYIWRWDPDWFWCSKHFFMQNPVVRLLLGKFCLRSAFYWKLWAFNTRHRLKDRLREAFGRRYEPVIQDVEIPIGKAVAFLKFLHKEIGIRPIWTCPFRSRVGYTLYRTEPSTLYVNFGFWDEARLPGGAAEGHFNRKIEKKVKELGGKKSLYSTSYYSEKEFWELHDRKAYDALKRKYDPGHHLKNLYEKCVRRR
jgi:FAD/FMN-containing dehydrogenase